MKQSSRNLLHSYFKAVIPFCDNRKGVDLLRSLGYQCDKLDADICLKAAVENKGDFLKPFSKIAKAAVESPKFLAHKSALTKGKALSKGTGDGSISDKDKVDYAFQAVSVVTDTLGRFYPDQAKLNNSEAAKLQAQANLLQAQNQAQQEASKTSNKTILIVGGCIGVLVLAIAIVAIVKRNR